MPESPSTYFPDHLVQFGWSKEREYGSSTVEFEAGVRQTVRLFHKVRRKVAGTLMELTDANIEAVRVFLDARFGPVESFWLFVWKYETFTDFSLGTGWDLVSPIVTPFKPATGIAHGTTVKKNGTPNVATTDTGGAGGEIRITAMTGGVLITDTVTISTTARERVAVQLEGNTVRSNFSLPATDTYATYEIRAREVWTALGF